MKRILFLVLALTVAGFAQAMGSQEPKKDAPVPQDTMMKSDDTMMKSDGAIKSDNSMMKTDSMMVSDDTRKMAADPMDITAYNLRGLGKQVVPFTTEAAAQMLAKTQTVVYYFAATWCPDCQSTYNDIKANFAKIPANVTIVFVDYDKAADLKTKFGVTTQHTFVVIGSDGMKKTVWSGATTVSDIVAKATMKAM